MRMRVCPSASRDSRPQRMHVGKGTEGYRRIDLTEATARTKEKENTFPTAVIYTGTNKEGLTRCRGGK